jgi:NADPH-dependent 2,4-dienoyl-CoA reductase/sulfur reductase-like enzyme
VKVSRIAALLLNHATLEKRGFEKISEAIFFQRCERSSKAQRTEKITRMDFEKHYDIAVAGGGIAGVAAALAAARAGKKPFFWKKQFSWGDWRHPG